jgi:hypothetical protein
VAVCREHRRVLQVVRSTAWNDATWLPTAHDLGRAARADGLPAAWSGHGPAARPGHDPAARSDGQPAARPVDRAPTYWLPVLITESGPHIVRTLDLGLFWLRPGVHFRLEKLRSM